MSSNHESEPRKNTGESRCCQAVLGVSAQPPARCSMLESVSVPVSVSVPDGKDAGCSIRPLDVPFRLCGCSTMRPPTRPRRDRRSRRWTQISGFSPPLTRNVFDPDGVPVRATDRCRRPCLLSLILPLSLSTVADLAAAPDCCLRALGDSFFGHGDGDGHGDGSKKTAAQLGGRGCDRSVSSTSRRPVCLPWPR